jgi:hypothetical protein
VIISSAYTLVIYLLISANVIRQKHVRPKRLRKVLRFIKKAVPTNVCSQRRLERAVLTNIQSVADRHPASGGSREQCRQTSSQWLLERAVPTDIQPVAARETSADKHPVSGDSREQCRRTSSQWRLERAVPIDIQSGATRESSADRHPVSGDSREQC